MNVYIEAHVATLQINFGDIRPAVMHEVDTLLVKCTVTPSGKGNSFNLYAKEMITNQKEISYWKPLCLCTVHLDWNDEKVLCPPDISCCHDIGSQAWAYIQQASFMGVFQKKCRENEFLCDVKPGDHFRHVLETMN